MRRREKSESVYTVSGSDGDGDSDSDFGTEGVKSESESEAAEAEGSGSSSSVSGAKRRRVVRKRTAIEGSRGGKAASRVDGSRLPRGRGAAGAGRATVSASASVSVSESKLEDLEDGPSIAIVRSHGRSWHGIEDVAVRQQGLLEWFEGVREKRGMPWRKRYDPSLSMAEKGQRAYEIWVSEVMLQQTQVATVIAYWTRWIAKWPTIADLAKADIEEVNAAWRGLGYYRRARALLAGAKTVMSHAKYNGRLPDDPAVLEKEIDGVGRYTAGAICSMAYGVQAPIVDGNVHRLLTRLLAVHALQTAPRTTKFLWQAAEELVHRLPSGQDGAAGDWNQALMELGSQLSRPPAPPSDTSEPCDLCAPIPASAETSVIPNVMVFPMRKDKKASRVEEEVVSVVEWRGDGGGERRWLFTKRPDKGLLAGLFEPPTTPLASPPSADTRLDVSLTTVSDLLELPRPVLVESVIHKEIGSIPHIFSHINMTYHILHLVLSPCSASATASAASVPQISATGRERGAVWLDEKGVEGANVGTGVKKVWAEVYGAWGKVDGAGPKPNGKRTEKGVNGANKGAKRAKRADKEALNGGKVVRKIMMPLMPRVVG